MKRMGGRETENYLGKKKKIKKRSGLHIAISFVRYFLIFDCLATEKTIDQENPPPIHHLQTSPMAKKSRSTHHL